MGSKNRCAAGSCFSSSGCGSLVHPLTSPFRLYILSKAKTLNHLVSFHEKFRSAVTIEDKVQGTEVSVPVPCRDGELPPGPSPSTPLPSPLTPLPSPSTLLTPMMRREYFSPETEGSTGSYVVHLSLSWCDLYVIMSFVSS
jgi:hypothetical protein